MTVGTYNRHQAQRKKQAALAAAFPQGVRCQKCLEMGHWSYECTGTRKMVVRLSRSQLLKRNLKAREENSADQKDKTRSQAKKQKKNPPSSSSSSSDSSSDSSDSSSDSSDSDSDSSSSQSSSDTE